MRFRGFVVLLLCLICMGCSAKDIDKRAIVVGLGVDQGIKNPKNFLVTLKIASPSADPKKSESSFDVLQAESVSISDAISLIRTKTNKELDIRQTKILLLGHQIAKENIIPFIDFTVRVPEIQLIAWTAVAKPSAKEVLSHKTKMETGNRNYINYAFINASETSSNMLPVTLSMLYRMVTSQGQDPFLPIVSVTKKIYNINQVALFNKKREVMELSPKDSKTFKMLKMGVKRATIISRYHDSLYTSVLTIPKGKFSFENKNNSSTIWFKLKPDGMVQEGNRGKKINQVELAKISQTQKQVIQKNAVNLLQKIQKQKIDPFGFGLSYISTSFDNNTKWKKWLHTYPNVQFKVNTKLVLKYSGAIR